MKKRFIVTLNGNAYDLTVEEADASAAVTAAMTAAAHTTGATFFFKKIPNMGTKIIYSVVINPALPTLVYLIPNCCSVLAIVREIPHRSPALTFSFQSNLAALSPAIFRLIRMYTRRLAAPIRERTPLKVKGCM